MVRSKPLQLRKTEEVEAALEKIWTANPFLKGKISATLKLGLFTLANSSGETSEVSANNLPEPEEIYESFSDNDNF